MTARILPHSWINSPESREVPRDLAANVEYRRALLSMLKNPDDAKRMRQAAARNPLWWVNSWAWTYDPRQSEAKIPMILYPFQEEVFVEICDAVENQHDLLIKKSRDMGITWVVLLALFWRWQTVANDSLLVVSRNAEYVDKAGNPKALMQKLLFILETLPSAMRPSYTKRDMHLQNDENGSVIDGEATTGDVGRGDRRRAILLDEFASLDDASDGRRAWQSTSGTTNCRIVNSTSQGPEGCFYELQQNPYIRKVYCWWYLHPEKAKGLYKRDNKLRSPWYDRECERAANPIEIAQEIDGEDQAASYLYFYPDTINVLVSETRDPQEIWDWETMAERLQFKTRLLDRVMTRDCGGKIEWWANPDTLTHAFSLGVDVSQGTGASNSAITIFDNGESKKCGCYVSPHIRPMELARLCFCLGHFLGGARIWWEDAGPGRDFGAELLALKYPRLFYRYKDGRGMDARGHQSDTPGWSPAGQHKLDLMSEYRKALSNRRFINPDRQSLDECRKYVYKGKTIEHTSSKGKDPSGAGANHGDRVIADAGAWMCATLYPDKAREPVAEAVEPNSIGGRIKAFEKEKARQRMEGWYV